jgi:hypothetical protein
VKNSKEPKPEPNKHFTKGLRTQAITDILETETEAKVPVTSDENVEQAREWINEHEL